MNRLGLSELQSSWTQSSPGARRQLERQSCLPTGREEGGSVRPNLAANVSLIPGQMGRWRVEDREDDGMEGR